MQSTSADSVATYVCMAGAAPSSPVMSTTCQIESGQWSPIPEPCYVVTCGQPPIVNTTDVALKTRSISGAYPGLDAEELQMAYEGQALYTCKDGIFLIRVAHYCLKSFDPWKRLWRKKGKVEEREK
ncbi:hypothetical protein PoB_006329500 [Plakobranchus ocellatus]|uniref:Sushi domain-containing protein n=1 Tax=Plakobranchus ocellatus TaxID=259542 RepID=A0AAV4CY42_9GAST|nr:hypothetical protein PoB_006329500 [Plakobranchus ocellatus]